MATIVDRILPITLAVCAALILLTLVACVVVAAWLDLRAAVRLARLRRHP